MTRTAPITSRFAPTFFFIFEICFGDKNLRDMKFQLVAEDQWYIDYFDDDERWNCLFGLKPSLVGYKFVFAVTVI